MLEVGYTEYETGNVSFVGCVTNVAGCSLFATCEPDVGTDEISITFQDDHFEGTMTRSDATQGCTVNFDISGVRE